MRVEREGLDERVSAAVLPGGGFIQSVAAGMELVSRRPMRDSGGRLDEIREGAWMAL